MIFMTKIVLTAAGKGTRLLPFTKEIPKEMVPIFSTRFSKKKVVTPLLQYIFEQLYQMNFREYCFITRREKRAIKDHFTPQQSYINELTNNNKTIINEFYKKIKKSNLVWIYQNKPLGFGDAVRQAERFVGKEDFLVHAGDVAILSKNRHPILRLMDTAKKNPEAKVVLLCKKVKDSKKYGVPTLEKLSTGLFEVKEVIEKPDKPKSNFGILPLYYFNSEIFSSLKKIKPGKNKEFQLTDAIQEIIKGKKQVLAIPLSKNEDEIDVGTIESYLQSQKITFRRA